MPAEVRGPAAGPPDPGDSPRDLAGCWFRAGSGARKWFAQLLFGDLPEKGTAQVPVAVQRVHLPHPVEPGDIRVLLARLNPDHRALAGCRRFLVLREEVSVVERPEVGCLGRWRPTRCRRGCILAEQCAGTHVDPVRDAEPAGCRFSAGLSQDGQPVRPQRCTHEGHRGARRWGRLRSRGRCGNRRGARNLWRCRVGRGGGRAGDRRTDREQPGCGESGHRVLDREWAVRVLAHAFVFRFHVQPVRLPW